MNRSSSLGKPQSRTGRSVLAISIYVVGAVLALVMVLPLGEKEPARASSSVGQEVEPVEPVIPQKAERPPRRAQPAAAPSSPEPAAEQPSPAGAADTRPHTLEELAAHLEDKLAHDASPTGIMVQAQNAFASLFTNPAVKGAALSEVKCGATVCRAQVVFDDMTSDDQFARYAFLDPKTGLNFGLDVSVPIRNVREDGSVEATIFMFKADPPAPEATE